MWLLEFIFFVITMVIAWILFGYFIYIWVAGLTKSYPVPEERAPSPPTTLVTLIVPCYNESAMIADKLADVRALAYPVDLLEVLFVDGGSSDDTVEILEKALAGDPSYRLLRSPLGGKINQLNYALKQATGAVIVNTDADARMNANALENIVAHFDVDPQTWVVGAFCQPSDPIDIEMIYWDSQNKSRYLETNLHSSSIVTAPCYAFRKELLDHFPEDVIADDIYVAMHASSQGLRVVQSKTVIATELRGPSNSSEFFLHKFRKSNAFLRETLRFLYRLANMDREVRIILLTRIAQQLFLPWLAILWLLLAGTLTTMGRIDLFIIATGFMLSMSYLTHLVFKTVSVPITSRRYDLVTTAWSYLIIMIILILTGLTFPWFRQSSVYRRLGNVESDEELSGERE